MRTYQNIVTEWEKNNARQTWEPSVEEVSFPDASFGMSVSGHVFPRSKPKHRGREIFSKMTL